MASIRKVENRSTTINDFIEESFEYKGYKLQFVINIDIHVYELEVAGKTYSTDKLPLHKLGELFSFDKLKTIKNILDRDEDFLDRHIEDADPEETNIFDYTIYLSDDADVEDERMGEFLDPDYLENNGMREALEATDPIN